MDPNNSPVGDKQVSTPSLADTAGANKAPAPAPSKPAASQPTKPSVPASAPNPSSTPTPQPAPALPIGASTATKDAELQGKLGAKVQGDQQVSPGAVSEDTGVDNPLTPFAKPGPNTKRYTVAATAGRKFWFEGTQLRPGDTVYLTDEQATRAGSRVEKA